MSKANSINVERIVKQLVLNCFDEDMLHNETFFMMNEPHEDLIEAKWELEKMIMHVRDIMNYQQDMEVRNDAT